MRRILFPLALIVIAAPVLGAPSGDIDLPTTTLDRARAACRTGDYAHALTLLQTLSDGEVTPEAHYLLGVAHFGTALAGDKTVMAGEQRLHQYQAAIESVDRAAQRQPEQFEKIRAAAAAPLAEKVSTATTALAPDLTARNGELDQASALFEQAAGEGYGEAVLAKAWTQFAKEWTTGRNTEHLRDLLAGLLAADPAAQPLAKLNAAHMLALLAATDDSLRTVRAPYEQPFPWLMTSDPNWADNLKGRLPQTLDALQRMLPDQLANRIGQFRSQAQGRITPEQMDQFLQMGEQRVREMQAQRSDQILDARQGFQHSLTSFAEKENDAAALIANPVLGAASLYRTLVTDDSKTGAYAASLVWLGFDDAQTAKFLQWARTSAPANAAWDFEQVRRSALTDKSATANALALGVQRTQFARPVLDGVPALLLPALYDWERLRRELGALAGSMEMVTADAAGDLLQPLTRDLLTQRGRIDALMAQSNLPQDREIAARDRATTLRVALRTPNLLSRDEQTRARTELAQLEGQLNGGGTMLIVSADGIQELSGSDALNGAWQMGGQQGNQGPFLVITPNGRTMTIDPSRQRGQRGGQQRGGPQPQ